MPNPLGPALRKLAAAVSVDGALAAGKHNLVSAAGGVRTMTLPAPVTEGVTLSVEKTDATANPVIVSGNIHGVAATTKAIYGAGEVLEFQADSGGSWYVVSGYRATDAGGHIAEASMGLGDRRTALQRRTGAVAETFSRGEVAAYQALATGNVQVQGISLVKGMVVNSITFQAGTTGGSGLTNQWFSLWSPTLDLLGATADDGATAWAANSEKTLAMASPYTVPADGFYKLGILVAGTTTPTIMGKAGISGALSTAPVFNGRDTTHQPLTNPASWPSATTLTLAGSTAQLYGYVS